MRRSLRTIGESPKGQGRKLVAGASWANPLPPFRHRIHHLHHMIRRLPELNFNQYDQCPKL